MSHPRHYCPRQCRKRVRFADLEGGRHRAVNPSYFRQSGGWSGSGWRFRSQNLFPTIRLGRLHKALVPGIADRSPQEGACRIGSIISQTKVVPRVRDNVAVW
eukprot:2316662-Rhodomonas_salina.1